MMSSGSNLSRPADLGSHLMSVRATLRPESSSVLIEDLVYATSERINDLLSNCVAYHLVSQNSTLRPLATFSIFRRINVRFPISKSLGNDLASRRKFEDTLKEMLDTNASEVRYRLREVLCFEFDDGLQVILSPPMSKLSDDPNQIEVFPLLSSEDQLVQHLLIVDGPEEVEVS